MPKVLARDGQALHVRVLGQGQPVLMLHGLGMSSLHWLPLVLPHLRKFQFFLPDFRGHGGSINTRLNQEDVFQNHCEDVQDLMLALGLNDVIVIGLSLGATTALHLQRETSFAGVRRFLHIDQSPKVLNDAEWQYGLAGERQPQLFQHMHRALALLAPYPDVAYYSELPKSVREHLAQELTAVLNVLGMSDARCRAIQAALPRLPTVIARRMPLMHLHDMRIYLRAYSGGGHDYRPSLANGTTPVTVITGALSPLYARAGQALIAEKAVSGRALVFERSGHVPFMDEPLRFYKALNAFLNEGR